MSLDLSSALRAAADHAPLGTLEHAALGRRIRRRRFARTAAQSTAVLGVAGAIAVTATHTPGFLQQQPGASSSGEGLPADQVAHTLPAADPAAAPGECGWTVRRPDAESPYELGVALGQYPQQTYSSMPVVVESRTTQAVAEPSPVRVVAAHDGVVVAVAPPDGIDPGTGGRVGPSSSSSGAYLSLLACGGPDASKALPDGDYSVYAVYATPGTDELVALSPGEPLVVAGNARQPWCGADASVIPRNDRRTDLSGAVAENGSADLRLTWSGGAEAEMLDQRIVLVDDATGRVVADSRVYADSTASAGGALPPGELVPFTVPDLPHACGDGPLASGAYRAYAVVTIAPHAVEGLSTNVVAVAELSGTVTVP